MKLNPIPVKRIYLDSEAVNHGGDYEFTVDCGAVYFGAVYNADGQLESINQYFYTQSFSRDDLSESIGSNQLASVDEEDFEARTYLLTKLEQEEEWLRFHAVVPQRVDPDYFYQKYVGD